MKIDLAILKKCEKNDRRAQFDLYKLCFSTLMSVCLRYKGNEEDAKELVNVGFLKIINNLKGYKPEVPFEAWIRRIMINTVIDEFRKNKKRIESIEYTDFENIDYDINYKEESAVLEKIKVEEMQMMIQQLPPMSKQVFNLFAIDGYSHAEIGDQLNISEGTSKWHVSSARKFLKEKILELAKTTKILV